MESTTPPSRSRTKSRLSKLQGGSPVPPQLSLEIVPSSPRISTPSPSPASSTVSPRAPYALPLRELLLLSPSPLKRSKTTRVTTEERTEMAAEEDNAIVVEASTGVRKRCKTRNSASGCAAAASPRSSRRSRRRLVEQEEREFVEEVLVKPRKKRHHGDRSRKTAKSVSSAPSIPSPKAVDDEGCNLDGIGALINDLAMWKDVSKSSLWFGFGSLCFLSSCFAKGVSFSIFSFLSQVGLLFLGVSFFSNSMRQRGANESKRDFKLREEDILKVSRLILPAANLAISKARDIFSGEPAMTLKVIPFFLVGAEYGHLISLWRLCALGFFISFTGPKFYSAYSSQLYKKVEYTKSLALDAWAACTHKRIVTASAVTAFWNLTSIRTRIFAAFLCVVILRYHRQHWEGNDDEDIAAGGKQEQQEQEQEQKALVVAVEFESSNK